MYIGSFDLNMKNVDPAAGSYRPKNTRAPDEKRWSQENLAILNPVLEIYFPPWPTGIFSTFFHLLFKRLQSN